MAGRFTSLVASLLLAVMLVGCAKAPTNDHTPSMAKQAEAPSYDIPPTIDAAYVSSVMKAILRVRGDVVRDVQGHQSRLGTDDKNRLASIYVGDALNDQLQVFAVASLSPPNPEIRNPAGDEAASVVDIVNATPTQIIFHATLDNRAVTKDDMTDNHPWLIELITTTGNSQNNPTPWKLSVGTQDLNSVNSPFDVRSQWNEDAFGFATGSPTPIDPSAAITVTPPSIPVTNKPLPSKSTSNASISTTTSQANTTPSGSVPNNPAPATTQRPASTSTTIDPLIIAAQNRSFAQQVMADVVLPSPDVGVLLEGGDYADERHEIMLDMTPYISLTKNGPYGDMTITATGDVTIDWGDGTSDVYAYNTVDWSNFYPSHIWRAAGTYNIDVIINWTPRYSAGSDHGTLTSQQSTGAYDNFSMTASPVGK